MSWLRRIFARREIYADLSAEIRAHLDEKVEALVAEGMPYEEAAHAARREFGNVLLTEERSRNVWRWPRLENLWMDARYTARRRGTFLAVEVLLLAVGFAVALLALSATRPALDPTLRVPHPDRTYFVGFGKDKPPEATISLLPDLERERDLFSAIGGFRILPGEASVTSGPVDVRQAFVTRGMIGFLPRVVDEGRPLVENDFQYSEWSSPYVLVTHSFLRKAGLTPSTSVGRVVHTSNGNYQIVGVFPGQDRFPWGTQPDMLIPFSPTPQDAGFLVILGQLRPGLRPKAVASELAASLPQSFPKTLAERMALTGIGAAFDRGQAQVAEYGLAVGTLGLVMLVATSSLIELLDTTRRRKELSIKLVLGATPGRLLWERGAEILMVCAAGLGLGNLLLHEAWPAISPIWSTEWTTVPRPGVFLLASAAGLLLFSCIVVGAGPGFVLRTVQPQFALKEGGSTASRPAYRVRMVVVALQIAVCVGFTLSAASLATQLRTLAARPLGLNVTDVWDGKILLPASEASMKASHAQAALAQLRARLQSIPGVEGAAFSSELPASRSHSIETPELSPRGEPLSANRSARSVPVTFAGPEYLQLLGCELLQGRFFTEKDSLVTNPPVILSEPLARRLFGDVNAVGKEVECGGHANDFAEVVGVVRGMRSSGLKGPLTAEAFEPLNGSLNPFSITVKTRRHGLVPFADVRSVVTELLPGASIVDFRSLRGRYDSELEIPRRRLGLLVVFSVIAAIVAVFGLTSVLFAALKEKDLEIGIRRALGASNRDLALALLRSVLPWIAGGVVLGVVLPVLAPAPFGLNAGASPLALAGTEVAALPGLAVLISISLWIPLRRAFRRPVSDLLRAE